MNKAFQTVTTILIIVLLFLLLWIFVSYYNSPVENVVVPPVNNNNVPLPVINNPTEIALPSVDEIDEKDNQSENQQPLSGIDDVPDASVTEIIKQGSTNEGSIIISSDTNISNFEKQQVLTEIDEALSELLLVVDSVKTVDETRLGIDEEIEVQP